MIEVNAYNKRITWVKSASALGDQAIMWVYAYHVGDTLLDAGCANAQEELRRWTEDHKIERVMVSHSHEDHYGGCAAFPKATIFADPITRELIQKPPDYSEFFRFVWGQPEPIPNVEMMPSEFAISDLEFQVIELPGHCEGMVGFWEPNQGWFFSADAVPLPSRKQIAMPEENIPQMVETMKRIRSLGIEVLFDGHRGPIENPDKHIQMRIDFLVDLQKRVTKMSQEGKTIKEIQDFLDFPTPWYLPNTEGRFGIDFLIRSLLEDEPIKESVD